MEGLGVVMRGGGVAAQPAYPFPPLSQSEKACDLSDCREVQKEQKQ